MSIDAEQTLFVKAFFILLVAMGQLKRQNKSKLIQDKVSDEKPQTAEPVKFSGVAVTD